jgi:tRNA (guanine37-N1)-methyltransferase
MMPSASSKKHKTVVVLLHHPVTNRKGELITTSITNMDIHDISRSCRTYEIDHYFLVSPLDEQRDFVATILDHWKRGSQLEWHPDRAEAFTRVEVLPSFEAVKNELSRLYPGHRQEVAMPDARPLPDQKTYHQIREIWASEPQNGVKVIVFGTGWGVAPSFFQEVHTFLAPIYGPMGANGYNHLSVRAAAAIVLDRLFSLVRPM